MEIDSISHVGQSQRKFLCVQACQVGSLLIENKYWRKRVTPERGPRGEIFRVCRSDFEPYFQMNQNSIYMNLLKVCQISEDVVNDQHKSFMIKVNVTNIGSLQCALSVAFSSSGGRYFDCMYISTNTYPLVSCLNKMKFILHAKVMLVSVGLSCKFLLTT